MHFSNWVLLSLLILIASSPLHLHAAENASDLKREIVLLKNQLQKMEDRITATERSMGYIKPFGENSTFNFLGLNPQLGNRITVAAQSNVATATDTSASNVSAPKKQLTKQKDLTQTKVKKNELPASKKSSPEVTSSTDAKSENALSPCVPISWQGPDLSFLIAGGASVGYTKHFGKRESFDILDLDPVLLFNYKDLLLMRSALSFSVDDQGNTSVGLDNLNLNLFINDYVVFGLGKFDSPLGSFVQNISPSWINRLPDAPVGFDGDEAAPQAQIGTYLQGGFRLTETFSGNYILFLANGPQGSVDLTNVVIDHISTDGFTNNHSNFITGVRLGILPIPKLEFGFSGAAGKLALIDMADNTTVVQRGRNYYVWGFDAAFKPGNWDLRGEYIQQQVSSDRRPGNIIPQGEKWKAWYLQVAYWIPTTNFEPVVRYGRFLAAVASQNQRQWSFGLDYWFTSSFAAQAAYEFNKGQKHSDSNNNQFLIQLVFGY